MDVFIEANFITTSGHSKVDTTNAFVGEQLMKQKSPQISSYVQL